MTDKLLEHVRSFTTHAGEPPTVLVGGCQEPYTDAELEAFGLVFSKADDAPPGVFYLTTRWKVDRAS